MFMLLHFVQRYVITRWIMMVLLLVGFSIQNTIWSVISQHVTTTNKLQQKKEIVSCVASTN